MDLKSKIYWLRTSHNGAQFNNGWGLKNIWFNDNFCDLIHQRSPHWSTHTEHSSYWDKQLNLICPDSHTHNKSGREKFKFPRALHWEQLGWQTGGAGHGLVQWGPCCCCVLCDLSVAHLYVLEQPLPWPGEGRRGGETLTVWAAQSSQQREPPPRPRVRSRQDRRKAGEPSVGG